MKNLPWQSVSCKVQYNYITELKFESGERIYFYEENDTIVLLLNGGGKTRQSNDIKTAENFLDDYKERNKNVK